MAETPFLYNCGLQRDQGGVVVEDEALLVMAREVGGQALWQFVMVVSAEIAGFHS